ncbi:hypothetical protein FDECE_18196 [Fusarium decemcellulare]|nr:hypothetical protein FDECE_18196 [Fusarium decemcellulare]
MVEIAIAAASSQVGREILDKLVATGNHSIIALIRKDPSSMPTIHGVQWVQTTYQDTSQLARTLDGIHTVLCFVDPVRDPLGDVQKRLIDASIQAGVKRFAPSEWSIGRKLEDCLDAIPWYASKAIVRKYLEEVNRKEKVLEYSLFLPGFLLNYLGHPHPTTKHITLFPMLFDFDNLRTIVVEEDLHARITFTTIQDIAGVVARAIEYDGEWPVYGGMGGGTATVAEILALGERIRGRPFNIRWVKKADVEAGTADLTPMWEEVHPTIAALPKEQREETAKVIPKGLLTMVGISAWETSEEWNKLLPDYKFTTIEEFVQQVWGGARDNGSSRKPEILSFTMLDASRGLYLPILGGKPGSAMCQVRQCSRPGYVLIYTPGVIAMLPQMELLRRSGVLQAIIRLSQAILIQASFSVCLLGVPLRPSQARESVARLRNYLTMAELPSIRWGIIATGMISSWFVADLVLSRSDAKVRHVIQSIGSSNIEKGKTFTSQFCPQSSPTVYGSYKDVYKDPNVDIIYIGTPHAFHKQNCLDAIAMGKPILCEKAFTLNAQDAKEVFLAAKKKGVYITEAMWLRHRPLVQDLQKRIHVDKMIGDIIRVYSDFGLEKDILSLPEDSRYRQPSLGAGSLLDLGIYPITWVLLCLDHEYPPTPEPFIIQATQTHLHGVEVSTAALLQRPSTGQHGVVSSTTLTTGSPDMVARIQGTEGAIEVHGECPSAPLSFTVYSKFTRDMENETISRQSIDTFKYPVMGRGYYFEADNAALDVLEGRLESPIMPWSESVRVLEIMDEIRRQGGTVYAGDSK